MNPKNFNLRKLSRIAGLLYLFVIAGGIFSEVFVRQRLFVSGDAFTTLQNILENEMLYRWGFAVGLFYLICNIPILMIFSLLFKRVHLPLTLLLIFYFLVGHTVEIVNMLNHYAPLDVLDASKELSLLDEETVAYSVFLPLNYFNTGFAISLVFFGCYCLSIGALILKSNFIPKSIGVLMAISGTCYLINSFSIFLFPDFASSLFPFILLPCFVAELSLATWLLIKGVAIKMSDAF